MKTLLQGILTTSLILSMVTVSEAVENIGSSVTTENPVQIAQTTQTLSSESDFKFMYSESYGGYILQSYLGSSSTVVIPDSYNGHAIIRVHGSAFKDNKTITSVTIPNTVSTIGISAFSGCSELKYVKLSSSLAAIENSAFNYCEKLTTIDLPSTVTEIGSNAFFHCSSLSYINLPNRLTSIGTSAFVGCHSLQNITLPASLQLIGWYAFSGCNSLKTATIHCDFVFNNTIQGICLFQECHSLQTVHISEGVTLIPSCAFNACPALTTVTLPETLTEIDDAAFRYCYYLTSIYLPKSLQKIGAAAFKDCYALTHIYYGGTVDNFAKIEIELMEEEFYNRTYRHHFDEATVVANSSTVQQQPLPITITDDFEIMGSTIVKYRGPGGNVVIPSEVNGRPITKIATYAFADCITVTSVTIPENVVDISQGAFENCKSLSSVTMLDSVIGIDYGAFFGCTALKSVTLPASVKVIGISAFDKCEALSTVYYGGTEANRAAIDIGNNYNENVTLENANWIYNSTSSSAPVTPEVVLPENNNNNNNSNNSTAKIATPSTAKVMVNGAEVPFGSYNIDGYNYFKLTDISFSIFGTEKQFKVSWDAEKNAINMLLGEGHTVLGTELAANSGRNELADLFTSPIYCDGRQVNPTVYVIDGSSYFQLASLVEILGITVGWDNATSTITITT